MALEQDRFRLLPGGILSKGIIRGYVNVLGLDEEAWMKRFLEASHAQGRALEDDSGWAAFASNVGKARLQRREAVEIRVRWLGAALLLLLAAVCAFLLVRYIGVRMGRWETVVPKNSFTHLLYNIFHHVRAFISRLFGN